MKIIRALVFFVVFVSHATYAEQRVIFCTFFTESHKHFAHDWMMPSLKEEVELVVGTGEQKCPSATFFKPGWTDTMLDKVQFIRDVVQQHMGDIVVFVDPDIIFFRPVKDRLVALLADKDFVGQLDSPQRTVCTGFFAMHANQKIVQFWQEVHDAMVCDKKLCDQKAFNKVLITDGNKVGLCWDFLPSEEFFGGGTFKKTTWKPGGNFHIPDNPRMFHAHFTIFKYKIPMMQHVLRVMAQRKNKGLMHSA